MEAKIKINEENNNILNVFYNHKKMTKNQFEFINDLYNKIINKININIFEFPPILDKDFLYCSLIYSLKLQNILPKEKKIIIIANSLEKIQILFGYFSEVSRHFNKFKNEVSVIPFLSRKFVCLNKLKLNNSNSYDIDSFCLEPNCSYREEEKCLYYKNLFQNKSVFSKPLTHIDIEDQLFFFNKLNYCPYYYYLFNTVNYCFDIIICLFQDFFDNKTGSCVSKMINFDININKNNNFFLFFDESNNLNEKIIQNFSINIDDTIIKYARIQLNELKNKYINNNSMKIDEEDIKINFKDYTKIILKPAKELLNYSLLINNNDIISGQITKSEYFVDLLSRLIIFISKFLPKNYTQFDNGVISSFPVQKLEYLLLDELWIDFSVCKCLYKRLIILFNEIKFTNYSSMHHLITFVNFINYISIYKKGYVINFGVNENEHQETFNKSNNKTPYMEYLLIEPNIFLQKFYSSNNIIFLSGGIGNLEIFSKSLLISNNLTINYKSYSCDLYEILSIKSNIFLTNTCFSTTTNPDFYGEILKKLCKLIPDGIILYFSSIKLMNFYLIKWDMQKVFDYILDYKLIFVEENNPIRNAEILINYKKSCLLGRGGLLILSLRNKMNIIDDNLYNEYSRGIIFIGYPIETKPNKSFEYKLKYYLKNYDVSNEKYFYYDTFKLFIHQIANKIKNSKDKKIIAILEKKLLDESMHSYLPNWLSELMSNNEDDNNVDERMNNIKNFLSE